MFALNTPLMTSDIDLFHDLPAPEMERVDALLHKKTYPAGTNIITAETPGEIVYIIQRGTVKIYVDQADGRDVILAILGPGDIVGEMSLLDSAGRSASVITLEESTLYWMSGRDFQTCMRTMPLVSQNLVRILSGRVRLANELIQALANLDVHGRVARQLLAFAERYGKADADGSVFIPIRLTQGDIADLVGASRKRVNTVMVMFREQGYLVIDEKGYMTLTDRKTLAKLCK
jgi:CRP/FNR family transcriptional regulator, cyclic AMP receptor protein